MTSFARTRVANSRAHLLTRRASLGLLMGTASAVIVGTPKKVMAATATSFDVTQAPFNADQSGNTDASGAIQAALNAISSLGAGRLVIPSGNYLLRSPLVCSGASLTISGDGQASSVFMVQHTASALTITCTSNSQCVTIRDIGFSPVAGGVNGSAIVLSFPPSPSGWQHCSIEDVDLGVARPNYGTFAQGLVFNNLWRGNIRNVNMHSNIGNVTGTSFVSLSGQCIDNRFSNCSVDGIDTGFLVNSYIEGLHVTDTVIIGNVAISTGTNPYSGDGSTTPLISLLGLYISGCEMNCNFTAANLSYVATGWISDSHFGSRTSNLPAMTLTGCDNVQLINCGFTGQFNPASGAPFIGLKTAGAGSWGCNNINVTDGSFTNVSTGVMFGPGTYNSSAIGVRMMAPGETSFVGSATPYGSVMARPCCDVSGNTTNVCQWVSSYPGPNTPATRFRNTY